MFADCKPPSQGLAVCEREKAMKSLNCCQRAWILQSCPIESLVM